MLFLIRFHLRLSYRQFASMSTKIMNNIVYLSIIVRILLLFFD